MWNERYSNDGDCNEEPVERPVWFVTSLFGEVGVGAVVSTHLCVYRSADRFTRVTAPRG